VSSSLADFDEAPHRLFWRSKSATTLTNALDPRRGRRRTNEVGAEASAELDEELPARNDMEKLSLSSEAFPN